jgi:hypothetical protein
MAIVIWLLLVFFIGAFAMQLGGVAEAVIRGT